MTSACKLLAALMATALISACSGGSGGGSTTSTGSTNASSAQTTPVATPPNPSSTPATVTSSAPPAPHVLKLSWTLPTTRENGTALAASELAGYQIYYYPDGSSAGAGEIVDINGGATNSTQLTIAGTGTYYFAIAARDTSGQLSSLSTYIALNLN